MRANSTHKNNNFSATERKLFKAEKFLIQRHKKKKQFAATRKWESEYLNRYKHNFHCIPYAFR